MNYLKLVLTIFLGYLIGSILTGEIVAKIKKVNIRSQGSGNVGATNVYRSMGSVFGALVLIGDTLKGVLAVYIGRLLGEVFGIDLASLAGIFVIAGHNWSVFAHFKGGKGIATSLGVIIGLTPVSLLAALPVWIGIFLLSGYVSLASVVAAVSYPISVIFLYPNDLNKLLLALILASFAVYRHHSNLKRLFHGEENRILYNSQRRKKDQ